MSTCFIEERADGLLQGLRMTAQEFLALGECEHRYELIDGVIVMSPSPLPVHQRISRNVLLQLNRFLENSGQGEVFHDMDIHLGQRSGGGDIVYRPDVFCVRSADRPGSWKPLHAAPILIVEVVSAKTRAIDTHTKRDDYERFGVQEYWLIDPERRTIRVHHLKDGRYIPEDRTADSWPSRALPGFTLDLVRIRQHFDEA